jgi:para-aminobenzoate synthetase / 4-amino-4-deoxychorismate lyase
MITAATPFVLLDDARMHCAAPSRLYQTPINILTANNAREVLVLMSALRDAQADGNHCAGYLDYEAGYAFEQGLGSAVTEPEIPLIWFGIFEQYREIDSDVIPSLLPDPAGAWLSELEPQISQSDYAKSFEAVQNYIMAGDIYQANLTFRTLAQYAGDPLALYAALRPRAAAGYGGVIWTGKQWHLSFSPELFFALKDGQVTTRPMKGTALRLPDNAEDMAAAADLQNDPKQRAENLMIVDLLRNDLSRVCQPGSVHVPELFRVDSYPTVHQMTSTVLGKIAEGKDAANVIEAIYPCGSITGAPKIRAMQIIEEIEAGPRRLYCGSIGRIDPSGDAAFNVAIRTFSLNEGSKQASLGLGSGIVADSQLEDEWTECLAKGEFARMPGYGFDLIETMRFEPAQGILRLELHLERISSSARMLGFEFDRHAARNQLHAVTFHTNVASKIRMLLSRSAAMSVEVRPAPPMIEKPWNVGILPLPVAPTDFRLSHKTSDRGFYDEARRAAKPCDEVLFLDPQGFLTEGSFTSLFVERDGILVTPPLAHGLLPSVLRHELIENGNAVEAALRPKDLDAGFLLGNSLRGLVRAKRVA